MHVLLQQYSQALQTMSNITDINEYRQQKQEQKQAKEIMDLLNSIMMDDGSPLIISIVDSDGNREFVNLDELMYPSDSNH